MESESKNSVSNVSNVISDVKMEDGEIEEDKK